ncbi:hypothetical protein C9374_002404 [Naegleria lovaniensis]|uniref:WH1 domain-containing protein n=1 Tax=Naegleria lovaniensis TaxID=51637 RepID=A0AA88GPQ1_NAELO|nr:uncharacterized protein C9374_002404 [Naegleria lovaniensis]KAG2386660.1 hypothetical protein C9374_002404 [Naegleria lovaniensis]
MNKELYAPLDVNEVLSATKGLSVEASIVVTLYECLQNESEWSYTGKWGVLYFGKDMISSTFQLMMLSVESKQVIWSHECYEKFQMDALNDHFISFESDDRIIGLNLEMNSRTSASKFVSVVNGRVNSINSSSGGGSTVRSSSQDSLPSSSSSNLPATKQPKKAKENDEGKSSSVFGGFGSMFKKGMGTVGSMFKKKDEKPAEPEQDSRRPLRESIRIGEVKNFKNVAHVGINQDTGKFEMKGLPPELMDMMGGLGLSPEQAEDPETQKKLVKYMHRYERKVAKERMLEEQHHMEQEASKQPPPSIIPPPPQPVESNVPPPPPVPLSDSSGNHDSRIPPPPPYDGHDTSYVSIPPPPPLPQVQGNVPPPPPLIKTQYEPIPPPPPPPPLMNEGSSEIPPPPPVGMSSIPPPPYQAIPPPPLIIESDSNDEDEVSLSPNIPPPPSMGAIPPPPPMVQGDDISTSHNNPIRHSMPPTVRSNVAVSKTEDKKVELPSKPADFLAEIKTFSKDSLKNSPPTDITKFTPQEKEGFKKYLMDKFSKARLHEVSDSESESDDDW